METKINLKDTEMRRNYLYELFIKFMYGFSGLARTTLEVFTRTDFGERYFRLSHIINSAIVLGIYPYISKLFSGSPLSKAKEMYAERMGIAEEKPFINEYFFWYVFIAAFVFMGIRHYIAKQRETSMYDFTKYSVRKGTVHEFFYSIQLPFMKTNLRNIECFIEPALFMIVGVAFMLIGQKVGVLLMIFSVLYGFSYVYLYKRGDDLIRDMIDDFIRNKHMERTFVDGIDEAETDGYMFRGWRPGDKSLRRQMLPLILNQEPVIEVD